NITWYLSWSPCWSCCDIIQDFLERQPNVDIDIRVARLYYPHDARNRRGLRELASLQGVTIQVMEKEDYRYCWETFV
ncbi:ABEC1 enzyme, partial [Tichodroma muraria]|nr:ABEC1 enzyme [Tichodroma muraria]